MDINAIEQALTNEGFDATLLPEGEGRLFPQMLVYLTNDEVGRERCVTITFKEQILATTDEGGSYYAIDFFTKLPFDVHPLASTDTAQATSFINRTLEFPGFAHDELEQCVTYRHVLLAPEDKLDTRIVASILGIILLLLDTFSATLENVAAAQMPFQQLLEDTVAGLR